VGDAYVSHNTSAQMKNVLEYDSFDLSFDDKKILSGIYMRCETGEVVGLLGRNGSGKSSLMKIVFGTLQAEYKSIRINGQSLGDDYLSKRLISYLPQNNLIPDYITINQACKIFKVNPLSLIEQYPDLSDVLSLRPVELSGGSIRLVEALLILNSPSHFCILDEPFSGLSPLNIEKLIAIILKARLVKGIIITDHLHRYVTKISDRLYILVEGRTYPISDQQQLVNFGYLNEL
jgi:ABC-type multidrug transport system ATPase subunit